MPAGAPSIINHAAFIWAVADLLQGDYKQSEYGRVILPFTVLRRLDGVLAPVKAEMLTTCQAVKGRLANFGPVLEPLTAVDGLWNTSRFDLPKLLDDPDNLADNLRAYVNDFSPEPRDILDKFDFPTQSTGWTIRSSSTWWSRSSRTSTCTRTGCPTSRWATCTRSWSASSSSCRTRRPGSTSRPARSSG